MSLTVDHERPNIKSGIVCSELHHKQLRFLQEAAATLKFDFRENFIQNDILEVKNCKIATWLSLKILPLMEAFDLKRT